jgi:hypothetical protein
VSPIRETKRFNLQPKQREFCRSDADICIYGGSAGGGKSFALLYEPIGRRLHEIKGFSGVVFRKSYPEITNPGGLWDEASGIYPFVGARGVIGSCEWRFPAGTRVSFRHLEDEATKYDYQGSQICYLAFDELTHFSESQFWYLLSRNRSICGVRPYVRATCNPDPGWVKELLAPWVDDGFQGQRAQSGELRWFIRVDGKIKWCEASHPDAKSLAFIRASIYDNQVLLSKDPGYLATLKALPSVERARLLDGDWNVRREGLVYPGFESCVVESHPGTPVPPAVGGMDFGFHNPFAAIAGHVDHDGVLWLTWMRYKNQCTLPVHSEALPKGVEWWCDPTGTDQWNQLRQAGHNCRPCVHMPGKGAGGEKRNPKLAGIDLVSNRMRLGKLKIVREVCLPLIRELSMYCYDTEKKLEEPIDEDNHACDALRYLIVGMDRGKVVAASVEPLTDEARDEQDREDAAKDLEARKAKEQDFLSDPLDDRWYAQ